VLAPPGVIAPAFGPDSFQRHLAAAEQAGVVVDVDRPASLTLDVDTDGDLDALRDALGHRRSGPRLRTQDVLDAIGRRLTQPDRPAGAQAP
jgi:2-phospho-L-lactate guanylyltransferase (CobY/MobA/RfbA family)